MTFFAPALAAGSFGPFEALWLIAILVAFLRGIFKEWERGRR